jgi:hypothetical protein
MERPMETVKRYEEGDSDEKLRLFLQFRELRDVFLDIDLKDPVIEKDRI